MNKLKFLKIFLGVLFLLFFIYNGFIAAEYKYEANGDAWDYLHLGLSVAKTGKYGHFESTRNELLEDFKKNQIGDREYIFLKKTAFRPPVWPYLIGVIFFIFGYSLTHILIFKFLLHLLGIYIFFKTLKLLKLSEILVTIGAFLYSVSPAWQLYSRVFLSEPITFFFITLWIYLLIRFINKKSSWWPQALVAGILVLCHPYFIFLPFTIWLLLLLYKQINLRLLVFSAALFAIVISTWIVRNFIVFDTNEVVLTASSGAVMAKGWNRDVPEKHTNTKGDLADETLVLEGFEDIKRSGANEVQAMQRYKDATLHFIRSNPDLILPIIGKKLLSAFNPFPETQRPGILETGRWFFHFLALLSLIYIIIFSKNKLFKSLALGLILSTIGITVLTYSGFRFRMPQVGLELLFIIYVIQDILQRRKKISIEN